MRIVHHASNPIEAHLVRHALEDSGLMVFVLGEHLQSGVGELPAGNLIRIAVPEPQVEAAEAVLRELPLVSGEGERLLRELDDDGLAGASGVPA